MIRRVVNHELAATTRSSDAALLEDAPWELGYTPFAYHATWDGRSSGIPCGRWLEGNILLIYE